MEIKNAADLRREYPELVNQVEQEAAKNAIQAERQRIRDIEEMSLPGSEEIANKAKFTEPVSAAEYAKAAMKHVKTQGMAYLQMADEDAKNSGIGQVKNQLPDGIGMAGTSEDEFMNAIKDTGGQYRKG